MKIQIHIIIFLFSIGLSACVSIEKVKTGEQALERKQYHLAVQLLDEEANKLKEKQKGYKYFLIAEAYRLQEKNSEALRHYQMARRNGFDNDEVNWQIAASFKQNGLYQDAYSLFDRLTNSENNLLAVDARRERDICLQVLEWKKRPERFEVKQISPDQAASVYFSAITPEGKLVISSDKRSNPLEKKYKWTGRYFSGLYQADPQNVDDMESLPGWGNESFHQGGASFNSDLTEMVYTHCDDKLQNENHCRLYRSRLINQKWTPGQALSFIKEGVNYGHPHIHQDSILFFTSNDPAGIGAYDLYFSRKEVTGWSQPILLPANINTRGNEQFPTIRKDTLYFSSDYHPGYGGLDIFSIHTRNDGSWSAPVNLHAPINSEADDFGMQFLKNADQESGYFNSSRNEPIGLDKIFYFSPTQNQVDTTILVDDDLLARNKKNYRLFLSLKIIEKVREDLEDPNSMVIGKRALSKVTVYENGSKDAKQNKADGRFISEIAFDSTYQFLLQKEGYLNKEVRLDPHAFPDDSEEKEIITISMEVEMIKPYFDQEVELENIYYDLDKWDIRKDAEATLNELSDLLKVNPDLFVEIGSHTDCRADETYNLDLSEKRAKSVVDYLLSKGIEESRMAFTGYGKSKLIENCPCESCSEKEHQRNRRTTFTLSRK